MRLCSGRILSRERAAPNKLGAARFRSEVTVAYGTIVVVSVFVKPANPRSDWNVQA